MTVSTRFRRVQKVQCCVVVLSSLLPWVVALLLLFLQLRFWYSNHASFCSKRFSRAVGLFEREGERNKGAWVLLVFVSFVFRLGYLFCCMLICHLVSGF